MFSPQRHRDTEILFFFDRSGDTDRSKPICPSGEACIHQSCQEFILTDKSSLKVGLQANAPPKTDRVPIISHSCPQDLEGFRNRYLPISETKQILGVSVSLW